MRAILVKHPGGNEVLELENYQQPEIKSNEVLVEIKAVGINYIDIYIRTGLYKAVSYPYIPGKEGSGVVKAVGADVKDLKQGSRVAFASSGSGTYAEYVAIPADEVVVIPDAISFETAAACMLQGLTAYYLSHLTYPLSAKHTALIHAGAGGVGTLLIQMAKNLGAVVITTVSTEDKANIAKEAGADHIIIYTQESFKDRVKEITKAKGVNVVYDAVGKTTFDDSLDVLGTRGMLVSYGQASGPVPPLDLTRLSGKSLFLTRPKLWDYTQNKLELTHLSNQLFELILKEKVKITIGQRYPLSEARNAHADLEGRKTIGKSLLLI